MAYLVLYIREHVRQPCEMGLVPGLHMMDVPAPRGFSVYLPRFQPESYYKRCPFVCSTPPVYHTNQKPRDLYKSRGLQRAYSFLGGFSPRRLSERISRNRLRGLLRLLQYPPVQLFRLRERLHPQLL